MIHFYCLDVTKTILISDQPVDKVRAKYGPRYEILNSVNDKVSVDVIKTRLARSYGSYSFVEWYQAAKRQMTAENKQKISDAKKGKLQSEATKLKISQSCKGRSNFQGKKHTAETKNKMAEKKLGNQHVKDSYWAYDSKADKETRVKDRNNLPPGYSLGRDYDSIEVGLYHMDEFQRSRSRNS